MHKRSEADRLSWSNIMEEFEQALLKKLLILTERGELLWHFAGEAHKICISFYRDTRLRLFPTKLEINDRDGDTVVVDALTSSALDAEFEQLLHAARRSAGNYPTGESKAISKNKIELYKKLLQD